MNSVPRRLTLGLGLAFVVAACGDDVTVQEPAPGPAPVVRSVVVSPASATVAPGGSFTFGAAVDADAGLARTVTWSSSNTTVATVTDGVATASAGITTGGVSSICAASTVDANIKGCAQLTVSPAAAPSTVQIDAATVGCHPLNGALPGAAGCGLLVPVQTNNVGGQVDISVLVNRAPNSGITGVELQVLGGTNLDVVEATYTQSLSGDFIAASDAGLAAQQTSIQNRIVFSVQTAAYTLGTNNVATVKHRNGQKKIRARLLGGTTQTASAVAETQLAFRNANGWHVAVTTNLNTGNNANTTCGAAGNAACPVRQISPATGLAWNGGTPLAITASAINFTNFPAFGAAGTGTGVAFGSLACDLSGVGGRVSSAANTTIASNTPANGTGPVVSGTLPYANGGAAGGASLNGYVIAPGGLCGAAGETPTAAAVDANGNPFINFGLGGAFAGNVYNNLATPLDPTIATAPAIRMDNGGPAAIAGYATGANLAGADRCFGVWLNGAQLDGNGAACPATPAALLVNGVSVNATANSATLGGRTARLNGWVNTAVNFGALNAAALRMLGIVGGNANGAIAPSATATGLPADAGMGGAVGFVARVGACNTVATCAALPSRTSVTGIAETATGFELGAIVQTVDLFGNVTNPPAAGANFALVPNPLNVANPYVAAGVLFIGVDVTNPLIAAIGGSGTPEGSSESLQFFPTGPVPNWNVTAQDQATALPAIASGVFSPGELWVSQQRRDAGSSLFFCPDGGGQYQLAGQACTTWIPGTTLFNQNAGAIVADPNVSATDAYYGATVFTLDQAGNQSANFVRTFIYDATGPAAIVATGTIPSVIPATGTVQYNGILSDNLDGGRASVAPAFLELPASTALLGGAENSAPSHIRLPYTDKPTGLSSPAGYLFDGPSTLAFTFSVTGQAIRSIELADGGGGTAIDNTVTNAQAAMQGFTLFGADVNRNFVSNVFAFGNPLAATGLVAGPAFWAAADLAGGQFMGMTWAVVPGPNAGTGTEIDLSGNAGNGETNSRTFNAVATGVNGVLQAPFPGGVKFYAVDRRQLTGVGVAATAINGITLDAALVEICTAGTPLNNQVANTWTYACTFNPGGSGQALIGAHDFFGWNRANFDGVHGGRTNEGFMAYDGAGAAQTLLADNTPMPLIAIGFSATGNGLATTAVILGASETLVNR